jgi:hypothetical protein
MLPTETQMLREIREIPAVAERQIREGGRIYCEEAPRLKREAPRFW